MSIFEYNEEQHLKTEREQAFRSGRDEGIEEGRREGIKEGLREGEARLAKLLQILSDAGRERDITRAISDPDYREQLYRENVL